MTTPAFTLRTVAPGDWPQYRAVRLRALQDAPDAFGSSYAAEEGRADAQWADRVAAACGSGRDRLVLAARAGTDTACGLVWCKLSAADPGRADLFQMWVDPAARGLGIGGALLGDVLAWAARAGAARVCLGVTASNSAAMRLYARHGFRAAGPTALLREGADLRVQPMVLQLGVGRVG
jgi:ribosomal protein S18 acetylase RimI-like enzyme